MKRIKVYNLNRNYKKQIGIKLFGFSVFLFLTTILLNNILNISVGDLLTNILSKQKIGKAVLYKKADKLTFNGTTWPVKEITDLSYQSIKDSGYSYSKLRKMNWNNIPENLKTFFPKRISNYIDMYKNITLQICWKYFSNPDELNKFTFMRRTIRTTWTASYKSKYIWIKDSGTHAGVDIIGNIGTPVYSIANGLVIEIKKGKTGFGNVIVILHKIDDKYFASFYGHLNSVKSSLKVGDIVTKGDLIGILGNSGNSSGPHLHIQINKVFTLQDIINGKLTSGWYHDLAGVKAYTVDPLKFIEKYYQSVGDDFKLKDTKNKIIVKKGLDNKKDLLKEKVKIKEKKDNLDLINIISKDLEHKVASIKKVSYIKDIDLGLIDNKVELGHGFTLTINVSTGVGNIGITPDNENLSFSPDMITNPDKKVYKINILAIKLGTTNLKIVDGKSVRNFKVKIYNKKVDSIFGIKAILTGNLNLLNEKKITIYPIDKLGRILDKRLNGNFKIYLVSDKGEKKYIKNIVSDDNKIITDIKGEFIGKGKIIIDSGKYYLKQNIITDLAVDSNYKNKFSNSISSLIKKGIVKGDNGKLYLNRKLSRREFITILGRGVLKVNYEKEKQNMLKFLKTKGRFFKDISGKVPTDVYIYVAYKNGIIKGYKGYSLANTNVSKLELLTILLRMYKIKTNLDNLNVWKDIEQNNNVKAIADTVKKFGLYPFSSYNYFNAGKLVNRLIAFETLYRFIDLGKIYYHTSGDDKNINKKNVNSDLENTISDIFNF